MSKKLLIITGIFFMQYNLAAQSKLGFENYHYMRQTGSNGSIVPMVHFVTKDNWYTELRYNYEDAQTLSLFTGKAFMGGNNFHYTITPMIGISAGNFTGYSFAVNTEADWNKFYLSSQTQYSAGRKKDSSSFFFNWSELAFNISPHLFSGLAMQCTLQSCYSGFEPGFVAGFNYKNISFPCYVFSPFRPGCYFVIGLNYEFNFKTKSKPADDY